MKPKKCKGVNKAKGSGCNKERYIKRYGLCDLCYKTWLLTDPIGKKVFEAGLLRGKKRTDTESKKAQRKEKIRLKEENKTLGQLKKEARTEFQKWIRFRDANDACISCGVRTVDLWDAGHFLKAELYSGLIFYYYNVNKQCKRCNLFLNGNESGYAKGIVKKYGQEVLDKLMEVKDSMRVYKWTKDEFRMIRDTYKEKLKNKEL